MAPLHHLPLIILWQPSHLSPPPLSPSWYTAFTGDQVFQFPHLLGVPKLAEQGLFP